MIQNNLLFSIACVFVFQFFAACSQVELDQIKESFTNEEIQATEKLRIYTDLPLEDFKWLQNTFFDEYNITLEVERFGAEQVIRRVYLERQKPQADVVILSKADRINRMAKLALLQPLQTKKLKAIPKHFLHPKYLWFGLSYSPRVIAYSKERVDPKKLTYYTDLAMPLWQGRLLMGSSEDIDNQELIGKLLYEAEEGEVLNWVKGIAQNSQQKVIEDDKNRLIDIFRGKGDLAVVTTKSLAQMLYTGNVLNKNAVEAIDVLLPNNKSHGASISITGVALIAKSKNYKNATIFLDFLLSPVTSENFAEHLFEFPVIKKAALSEKLQIWANVKIDTSSQFQIVDKKQEVLALMKKADWR
ncbi:MAG: extracellular solute-binding protein [Bacteroidota bacterium]